MSLDDLKNKFALKIETCDNMTDLRVEIDQLDQKIVELIAIRQNYMDQAAHIKPQRALVRDKERVEDVINKVMSHCQKVGANQQLTEELYRTMIEWSIGYEFKRFDQLKK